MKSLKLLIGFLLLFALVTSVSATCMETDDGKDYYDKGTATDNTGSYSDTCGREYGWADDTLIEYYCDAAIGVNSILYTCPDTCENGKCTEGGYSSCTPAGYSPSVGLPCCEGLLISQCDGKCIAPVYGENYAYGDCVCSPGEPLASQDCADSGGEVEGLPDGASCILGSQCASGMCANPDDLVSMWGKVCISDEYLATIHPCWDTAGYIEGTRSCEATPMNDYTREDGVVIPGGHFFQDHLSIDCEESRTFVDPSCYCGCKDANSCYSKDECDEMYGPICGCWIPVPFTDRCFIPDLACLISHGVSSAWANISTWVYLIVGIFAFIVLFPYLLPILKRFFGAFM
jgi:hypothetical protein